MGLDNFMQGLSMQVDPAYRKSVYADRRAAADRKYKEEERARFADQMQTNIGQRAQEQVTAPYQQSEDEMFPGELPIQGLEDVTQEASAATGMYQRSPEEVKLWLDSMKGIGYSKPGQEYLTKALPQLQGSQMTNVGAYNRLQDTIAGQNLRNSADIASRERIASNKLVKDNPSLEDEVNRIKNSNTIPNNQKQAHIEQAINRAKWGGKLSAEQQTTAAYMQMSKEQRKEANERKRRGANEAYYVTRGGTEGRKDAELQAEQRENAELAEQGMFHVGAIKQILPELTEINMGVMINKLPNFRDITQNVNYHTNNLIGAVRTALGPGMLSDTDINLLKSMIPSLDVNLSAYMYQLDQFEKKAFSLMKKGNTRVKRIGTEDVPAQKSATQPMTKEEWLKSKR